MTNFDRTIDRGLEAKLKAEEEVTMGYSAWGFAGEDLESWIK